MSALKCYEFLICFLFLFTFCEAYKMLVVFPYPSKSHGYLGDGVVRNLLKEGHEVTYISPFNYTPSPSNLRLIDVSDNFNLLPEVMYNFQSLINKEFKLEYSTLVDLLIDVMKNTLLNDKVQIVLNDPKEKFDVVIVEWMFTEIVAGYAAVFDCPYIWVSSFDTHWLILRLIDQSANPSYIADITSSTLAPFTFWERITELSKQLKVHFLKYMYYNQLEKKEYDSLFAPIVAKQGRQLPPYYDMVYNASLILGNSHPSMGKSMSLPRNYIPVGGYYIDENLKPLSEELKYIMDNSKHGVIYFSMGSNLKSKDMPKVIRDSLLKMFSELKQTVFWKFEEDMTNIPINVHMMKWAPQHSILAHNNTLLFISHGGLLSTTEAIHFGVPIIGVPVFFDQSMNIIKAVNQGMAKKVDLSYNFAKDLKNAIEEVLNNKTYAVKAKKLSFIYHDRPITPGKELSHWVRHVIETRGAPHLRSPALHVPLYQKLYLDLIAAIFIILVLLIMFTKYIYCTINIKSIFNNAFMLHICKTFADTIKKDS